MVSCCPVRETICKILPNTYDCFATFYTLAITNIFTQTKTFDEDESLTCALLASCTFNN